MSDKGAGMMFWRIALPIGVAVYMLCSGLVAGSIAGFVWWHPALAVFIGSVVVAAFGGVSLLQRERDRNALDCSTFRPTDAEKDVIIQLRKKYDK